MRRRQDAVPRGRGAAGQVHGATGQPSEGSHSTEIAASRRRNEITVSATLPRLGSAVTRIPRVLPAAIPREQTVARSLPRVGLIASNRRAQAEIVAAPRRPTEPASLLRVHLRGVRQVQPRSTEALPNLPPPRPLPVFHNPRLQALQGQDSPQFRFEYQSPQAIIANSGRFLLDEL